MNGFFRVCIFSLQIKSIKLQGFVRSFIGPLHCVCCLTSLSALFHLTIASLENRGGGGGGGRERERDRQAIGALTSDVIRYSLCLLNIGKESRRL